MGHVVVLAKPDAVRRNLQGYIRDAYCDAGFVPKKESGFGSKCTSVRRRLERHYAEHKGKAFYGNLITQMTAGPVVAYQFEVPSNLTVGLARKLCMKLRAELAQDKTNNSVHCSDSPQSAQREMEIWFPESSA